MSAPEIIHINLNAADGWQRFAEVGMKMTHREPPRPDDVFRMLAGQAGKLFLLHGFVPDTQEIVGLKILDSENHTLGCENIYEPPFTGRYEVASEPPPRVSSHGDYLFDLTLHG